MEDNTLCFVDEKGVIYYELLKSDEIGNTECCRQQMIDLNQILCEKRLEHQKRRLKVILFHDNPPTYAAKLVKETIAVRKYFRMRFTHQTWLPLSTTYLHRLATYLLNNVSVLDD
ncbi:hypothetical protein CDAR_304661 [Caerostris darwini]|uniref:Mariner Mos1 transposase n=1 Tax=Caerostris darwini TaxID=1538125 RepID=A0AAV4TM09_9ARAC|nr:hypothetical protein CDAR_304661 [Caerostris darwini]